ncbi:hypothetical protein D3C87_1998090 [compost metagenome]
MHQKPGGGGLAAAAFTDNAERFTFQDVEIDAIDGAHDLFRLKKAAAFYREMLDQTACGDQRLSRAAAFTERKVGNGGLCDCPHDFTSIA